MKAWFGVLLATTALAVGACGGDDGSSGSGAPPPLTVSAAASLKAAFTEYGKQFKDADSRFSFAGSDELAAQIEKGVKPDVFAAANTKLPDDLYAKGLVEKPTVFAGNELVFRVVVAERVADAIHVDLQRTGHERELGRVHGRRPIRCQALGHVSPARVPECRHRPSPPRQLPLCLQRHRSRFLPLHLRLRLRHHLRDRVSPFDQHRQSIRPRPFRSCCRCRRYLPVHRDRFRLPSLRGSRFPVRKGTRRPDRQRHRCLRLRLRRECRQRSKFLAHRAL